MPHQYFDASIAASDSEHSPPGLTSRSTALARRYLIIIVTFIEDLIILTIIIIIIFSLLLNINYRHLRRAVTAGRLLTQVLISTIFIMMMMRMVMVMMMMV